MSSRKKSQAKSRTASAGVSKNASRNTAARKSQSTVSRSSSGKEDARSFGATAKLKRTPKSAHARAQSKPELAVKQTARASEAGHSSGSAASKASRTEASRGGRSASGTIREGAAIAHQSLAAMGASGRTSPSRRSDPAMQIAGIRALEKAAGETTKKRGADVGRSSKADTKKTRAPLRQQKLASPVATIAVSSRSGGEKVKGIDTIKSGPRSGEAGASAATAPNLPNGYRPTETEPFMNERQRLYFRNKLLAWKDEIVRQNRETLQGLHEDSAQHADVADRATFETDRALELRARDRQRKLISKIDAALARIEEGTYGYCEETGEPISLKRLDARPIATLSIEAQERHERRERVFREE